MHNTDTFTLKVLALCGLLQGGSLSAILWSADEHLLKDMPMSKFSPLSVMSCKMQHMILGIEKWCRDKELSVNTSKTEMVLVTRRNKAEQLKTLRLPSTTVIN